MSSFSSRTPRATDDGALSSRSAYLHPLSYDGSGIRIAPSRSSSLRRTSSLTDLDKEFAGVVEGIIGSESPMTERTERRRAVSSFYGRRGEEDSQSVDSVPASEEAARPRPGGRRGAAASTYYSMSSIGPNDSASNIGSSDYASRRSGLSGSGTQIVPSTMSYRRAESNSLLGDSHSGPTTTTRATPLSPTTRSATSMTMTSSSGYYTESDGLTSVSRRSPDTFTSATGTTTTGAGLSRRSEVRRRTPRTASRTFTSLSRTVGTTTGTGTGSAPSESDKENETVTASGTVTATGTAGASATNTNGQTEKTGSWDACDTSCWSSLGDGSYTASSFSYSFSPATSRTRTLSQTGTPSSYTRSSQGSTSVGRSESDITRTRTPSRAATSSEEDVFMTPSASTRTSFYSAKSPPRSPTPTPATPTSTTYLTAERAPSSPQSTLYESAAEPTPSEPDTEFVTAESPSTPPATEYGTAQCWCPTSSEPEEEEMIIETDSVTTPLLTPTPLDQSEVESIVASSLSVETPIVVSPSETEDEEMSLPDEISELTRSPTISLHSTTPSIQDEDADADAVSLYAPSVVPTIPDELDYAAGFPLPPSVAETESLLSSPRSEPPPPPSVAPSTPTTVSTPIVVEDVPPEMESVPRQISTPTSGLTPTPDISFARSPEESTPRMGSLSLSSVSSPMVVSPSSVSLLSSPVLVSASSVSLLSSAPSSLTASVSTPTPSSLTSSPTPSISESAHEGSPPPPPPPPSEPVSDVARSVPSRSDGYESSVLMPSPSIQSSIPMPEGADKSFETSFMRPSMSEMHTEDVPASPFEPPAASPAPAPALVPPSPTPELAPPSPRPESQVVSLASLGDSPIQVHLSPPTLSIGTEISTTSTPTQESTATVSSLTTLSSMPRVVTLSRSPSSVSAISSVSLSSSIFYPRSIYDEEEEEPIVEDFKYLMSPATVPSLLSSRHSRSPSSDRTISPRTVPTLLSEREESLIVGHIFFGNYWV